MLSLPPRTQSLLEFFFANAGRGSFVASSEESADAAIFDLDTQDSCEHWKSFHARTGRTGLALAVKSQAVDGAIWLQKPVTPAALLAAAGSLREPVAPPAAIPELHAAPQDVAPEQKLASQPLAGDPVEEAQPAEQPKAPQEPVPASEAPAVQDESSVQLPSTLNASDSLGTETLPSGSADEAQPEPPVEVVPSWVQKSPTETRISGFIASLRKLFASPIQTDDWARAKEPADKATAVASVTSSAAASASEANAQTDAPTSTSESPQPPVPQATPSQPVEQDPAASNEQRTDPSTPEQTSVSEQTTTNDASPAAAGPPLAEDPTGSSGQPDEATAPEARPDNESSSIAPPVSQERTLAKRSSKPALAPELLQSYFGTRTDATAEELLTNADLHYDPEQYLVGALREAFLVAKKWQVPTQFECVHGSLVVDAERNQLHTRFDPSVLDALASLPLANRSKVVTLSNAELDQFAAQRSSADGGLAHLRLDDQLWRAGLLASCGRMPINSDVRQKHYLQHWPNLTRLTPLPNSMRIAALWATRGASLLETVELLRVEQRYVIGLYNAAWALNLITSNGSHLTDAQRRHTRNRGLLTRLLGWLRG